MNEEEIKRFEKDLENKTKELELKQRAVQLERKEKALDQYRVEVNKKKGFFGYLWNGAVIVGAGLGKVLNSLFNAAQGAGRNYDKSTKGETIKCLM